MLEYLVPSYTISPEGPRTSQQADEFKGVLQTLGHEQGGKVRFR